MIEKELLPCPFCGSTRLKVESKTKYVGWTGIGARVERRTYSVRCNVCYARGGAVGGEVITSCLSEYREHMPDWAMTDEKMKERAIEAWNLRIGRPATTS